MPEDLAYAQHPNYKVYSQYTCEIIFYHLFDLFIKTVLTFTLLCVKLINKFERYSLHSL